MNPSVKLSRIAAALTRVAAREALDEIGKAIKSGGFICSQHDGVPQNAAVILGYITGALRKAAGDIAQDLLSDLLEEGASYNGVQTVSEELTIVHNKTWNRDPQADEESYVSVDIKLPKNLTFSVKASVVLDKLVDVIARGTPTHIRLNEAALEKFLSSKAGLDLAALHIGATLSELNGKPAPRILIEDTPEVIFADPKLGAPKGVDVTYKVTGVLTFEEEAPKVTSGLLNLGTLNAVMTVAVETAESNGYERDLY